jgi:hypothetical protein
MNFSSPVAFAASAPGSIRRAFGILLKTVGAMNLHLTGAGSFKAATLGISAAAVVAMTPSASFAQSTLSDSRPISSAPGVPTTKLLAIGTRTSKATAAALKPILPSEVRETVQLYLAGKIDQWFVKQDQSGVIFILNLTDPEQGKALLESLPLGRAGLMEFQIIPIGPLAPLGVLLSK